MQIDHDYERIVPLFGPSAGKVTLRPGEVLHTGVAGTLLFTASVCLSVSLSLCRSLSLSVALCLSVAHCLSVFDTGVAGAHLFTA